MTSTGTTVGAPLTARESASGRCRKWCACAPPSARTTTPPRRDTSSHSRSLSSCPTLTSDPGSSPASHTCSDSARRPKDNATRPFLHGGASSSTSLDRHLLSWSSRICNGPTLGSSTSSSRSSSGRARNRSSSSVWRVLSSWSVGRVGERASAPSCRSISIRSPETRCANSSQGSCATCPNNFRIESSSVRRASRSMRSKSPECSAAKGLLVERDGTYEASEELSDFEVPDSLHSLIASRLDSLPAEERSLLQDAAVLGKSFSTAALSVLTGASPNELEVPLRNLVRKELLLVDNDPRSPERGQYGFLQGLIREVAHSTLGRKDRRTKHLAAAHFFESLDDDELSGVVAAHYLEAYEASPDGPEREALGARARDTLTEAGRRAMSLGSPEQALSYFRTVPRDRGARRRAGRALGARRARLRSAWATRNARGRISKRRSSITRTLAMQSPLDKPLPHGHAHTAADPLGSSRQSREPSRAYADLGDRGEPRVRARTCLSPWQICVCIQVNQGARP